MALITKYNRKTDVFVPYFRKRVIAILDLITYWAECFIHNSDALLDHSIFEQFYSCFPLYSQHVLCLLFTVVFCLRLFKCELRWRSLKSVMRSRQSVQDIHSYQRLTLPKSHVQQFFLFQVQISGPLPAQL